MLHINIAQCSRVYTIAVQTLRLLQLLKHTSGAFCTALAVSLCAAAAALLQSLVAHCCCSLSLLLLQSNNSPTLLLPYYTLRTLHNVPSTNNSYSAHLRDNRCEPGFFKQPRSKDVDVSVHVLTTGYWPAYPPSDVAVPAELADHMARFEDYYMAKYQVRAATVLHLYTVRCSSFSSQQC
jgi:Cullin family